jgi:hypothetical protein
LLSGLNSTGILPSKQIENKADNGADNNARGDWKVKTEATSLEVQITWQMPEPRDFSAKGKQHSEGNDYDPQNYQSPAYLGHKIGPAVGQRSFRALLDQNKVGWFLGALPFCPLDFRPK